MCGVLVSFAAAFLALSFSVVFKLEENSCSSQRTTCSIARA